MTEDIMKKHAIQSVLVCGNYLETPFSHNVKYKIFSIFDDTREKILGLLDEGVDFVATEKKEGKSVLIHCQAGRSRSGSFAVAYIMKTRGLPYEESLNFIKKKRWEVQPNRGFAAQLRLYEKQLKSRAPHQP